MTRRVAAPVELRALAHPVRLAIIEQLSLDGPLTATELAERLDESPANCSWHLRKLAEHQFIEEAPREGRRRPWRMAEIGFSWRDARETAEGRHAALALSDLTMGRSLDRYREAAQRHAAEPPAWQDAAGGSQTMAWVTADELRELNAEIHDVVMRHVGRLEDPGKRPDGARLCELVSWGIPVQVTGIESEAPQARVLDLTSGNRLGDAGATRGPGEVDVPAARHDQSDHR